MEKITYDKQSIEVILNILNTMNVLGIENATKLVQVFELLKQYEIQNDVKSDILKQDGDE